MATFNFRGYRPAASRFIGKSFNGIKVEAVLAKIGSTRSSTEYLAICRDYAHHSLARVVNYNHVVQAAAGAIDLRSKYEISVTPAKHGLVSADVPVATPTPSNTDTLIGSIKKQATSATGTVDLDQIDLAGALFVMNKLVLAAKSDKNITELVKLIATTL